jgi:hypothetical protein
MPMKDYRLPPSVDQRKALMVMKAATAHLRCKLFVYQFPKRPGGTVTARVWGSDESLTKMDELYYVYGIADGSL